MYKKVNLDTIKMINLFEIFENHFGMEYNKKKSSKYGRYYKGQFGRFWVRYDYNTGKYFYTSLDNNYDKGTIIDFIQNNIIKEKNIGKVIKYLKENKIIQQEKRGRYVENVLQIDFS